MKNLLLLLVASALPVAAQTLPERKDVVSWQTLSQVELVKQKDRYVPKFAAGIAALDKQDVRVQGFMMPLQVGDKQTHFVLASAPQTCAFCMPGGPETMVEIKTKTPVKYTFEPVVVSGRLIVLRDDPAGIYYRILDATPVK